MATALPSLALPPVPAPATAPTAAVYLPDSAAANEKLRLAHNLEKAGDWSRAAEAYQEILETFPDKLASGESIGVAGYVSIPRLVTELLCHWPADGIAVYRGRYEPAAAAMLAAADHQNAESLMKVADRYFITDAGTAASLEAIDNYWSRGDMPEAARLIALLLKLHPQIESQRPLLLYQLALAQHLLGDSAAAQSALRDLQDHYPQAVSEIAQQQVVLASDLATRLAQPAQRHLLRLTNWPMLGGSPARDAIAAFGPHISARLYSLPLAAASPLPRPQPILPLNITPEFAPVADHGELYLSDGNRVGAISLDSGSKLPDWPDIWVTTSQSHQTSGLQSLALTPHWVFAVTGATTAPGWLRAMGQATETASVVRIQRRDGSISRRFSPTVLRQPALRNVQLTSAPLVNGNRVYVAARGGKSAQLDDAYVLCLDENLECQWMTYLASGPSSSTNFSFDEGIIDLDAAKAQFALGGGRVVVVTNLGAVASVDATTGVIAWMQTYERRNAPQAAAVGFARFPRRTGPLAPRPAWSDSPPILAAGKAFVLPTDGKALLILNAETGQLEKRLPLSLLDEARCLVAVDGDEMVLAGAQSAWCVNWKTLAKNGDNLSDAISWNMRFAPGNLRGRPFLTADSLYLATDKRLFRIRRDNWKVEEAYPAAAGWPKDEGPGNLLITPDHVVVAGGDRLNVYASLAAAQQTLQAQAQADPQSPDPLLRLAELSAGGGDYAAALPWLLKAQPLGEQRPAAADRLHNLASQGWREMRGKTDEASRTLAQRYLELARQSARTPMQRSTFWLALADLASRRGDAAAELDAYDHVLQDEAGRNVLLPYRGRTPQPAWLHCHDAIRQLIRSKGEGVYASHEALAITRFTQARAAGDAARLAAAARELSSASGAPAALVDAARMLRSAGDNGRAADLLRDGQRLFSDTPLAPAILEEMARTYILMPRRLPTAANRLRLGAETLGNPRLREPLTLPGGGVIPAGATFASAAAQVQKACGAANDAALPDFALAIRGSAFAAEIRLPDVQAFLQIEPHDDRSDILALVHSNRKLSIRRPGDTKPLAEVSVGATPPHGGCWLDRTLFAWSRDGMVALDSVGGRTLWTAAALPPLPPPLEIGEDSPQLKPPAASATGAPVFPQGVINPGADDVEVRPGQADAESVVTGDAAGSHLVVATSQGRIAALDPATGKIQWQLTLRDCTPRLLVTVDDYSVVTFNDRSPLQLAAFDNVTGQLVYRIARIPGLRLLNFDLAEGGRLVFTLPGHLCARDLFDTGDSLAFDVTPSPAEAFDEMVFPAQLQALSDRILAITGGGKELRSFSLQTGKPIAIPLPDSPPGAYAVPTFSTDAGTLVVASEPCVYTCSRTGVAAYNLEAAQQPQRRLPRDARDIRFFALGQQHLVLFDVPTPPEAPRRVRNNPFAPAPPPAVATGGPSKTMRILAYSRARAASGEVGLLEVLHELNDPAGIGVCNAVEGGIAYISGDNVLHYLPGAARAATQPASRPATLPAAQEQRP